jgi:hypothetical protein
MPPATGACCLPNGHCMIAPEAKCDALHGTYGGNDTTCAAANCPPPACPCDWNHDNVVNQDDLHAFLTAFANGTADFNGDGVTNNEDLFGFIACFRLGCR